ncbi:restriction endonuclease subunit S [Roseibium salinum]|uniref:Restriction endonuclease subunit S n=1 Tax=Roseibium salinum TaxID=1604349 RepID=A0ABT3R0W0_9HYPH|nr:restriction endonuclease subunit S [Roseibium sp. DSM 29163]MCX2722587.1 restriction endonuclease subunit S [Roseibium sp. DSM 29163]
MTADVRSLREPTLRFPEFVGRRLPVVRLRDVTVEAKLRNGDKLSPASVMGVRKHDGIVPMQEGLAASNITRYKIVRPHWFAYNPMRLNIGSIARWNGDDDILVSPDYVVFRCTNGSDNYALSADYLDQFRQSEQWNSFVSEAGDGGVRVRIYYNDIAELRLALPDIAEQQKIADCLGSLDDLIAAEGRKLEALRRHKKGLMQQLFPQPGETVPRLRFPEFEGAQAWKHVPLASLLVRMPDYGVSAPAVPFSDNLPTYIRITDINDDGRFHPSDRSSVDIEATDDQYLEAGDIVLARTGASVGKSYLYREEDGRLVYAGFLIRVRPDPKLLFSRFLAAYLSTSSYWDWVYVTSERSGQPGINSTEYASMPLPIPQDGSALAEQRKIADCFSCLDDQISVQACLLDTLKRHKQGLLQQLFLRPEASGA